MIDIKNDLLMLEFGWNACKLGKSLFEIKEEYLKRVEKVIEKNGK